MARHRVTEAGLDGTVFSYAEFSGLDETLRYWNERASTLPKDRTLTESVEVRGKLGRDWLVIMRWPFN